MRVEQFWFGDKVSEHANNPGRQVPASKLLGHGPMLTQYDMDEEKSGIHLVSTTSAQRREERRLTLGNYTADIVVSKREEHLCYYVIQQVGSAEIIEMQPFDNPENAEAAAERALQRWNRRDILPRRAS